MTTKFLALMFAALMFQPTACDKAAANKATDNADASDVYKSVQVIDANQDKKAAKIQVALLLDTSNSMDGLIEQAKSQLWKMVNELATTKKKGKTPDIEIALFQYGNDGLSSKDGYIQKITDLTTDLDLVSEKLFEVKTNGGSEYCGWAISDAVDQLEWTKNNNDLKLIIIAGNEPYDQGKVNYKDACKKAIAKGIMINTIFCGHYQEGVNTHWQDGAECADGKYLNINKDDKVVHIDSPYDKEILQLNKKLNDTYIGYGSLGATNKIRQEVQDSNAGEYSQANVVERASSKSKKAYKNDSWDLVDATEESDEKLEKIKDKDLPSEMKGMNKKERKEYVEKKRKEREEINSKIKELDKKRKVYVANERKNNAETQTLDNVMMKAVREQAKSKKFKVEEK